MPAGQSRRHGVDLRLLTLLSQVALVEFLRPPGEKGARDPQALFLGGQDQRPAPSFCRRSPPYGRYSDFVQVII